MSDDIRPRGSVEVPCSCGWCFWVDPLDPRLPAGPFACPTCAGVTATEKEPDDVRTRLRAKLDAMSPEEIAAFYERLFRGVAVAPT